MRLSKIFSKNMLRVAFFAIISLFYACFCIAKEETDSVNGSRVAVTSKIFVIKELKNRFKEKSKFLDYEIYFKFAATEVERRHKYMYVLLSDSNPIVSHGDWINSGKRNHIANHSVEEATYEILEVASSEIERYLSR